MDQSLRGLYGSSNGLKVGDESLLGLSDLNLVNWLEINDLFVNQNDRSVPCLPQYPMSGSLVPCSYENIEGDSNEDFDFSDVVLKYINDMLMEEDMEEKTCMFQESLALQAAEKSFYEVLGKKYPPSYDHHPMPYIDENHESSYVSLNYNNYNRSNSITNRSEIAPTGWKCDLGEYNSPCVASQSISQTSSSSSNSVSYIVDGFIDSPVSTLRVPEIFGESESVMQFKRGVEEASKFLPVESNLVVDLETGGGLFKEPNKETKDRVVKLEKQHGSKRLPEGLRGKRNPHPEEVDLEGGRSNKQSAVCSETTVSAEMFDMVLLNCGKDDSALRQALQNGASKNVHQNSQAKGSNGGKSRGKKRGGKRDVVDLRTLLTLCAQAVAGNDRRNANELLKQIRQHSTVTGDGMQRMAHYFANGLEARLAGYGTQIYTAIITRITSAADILKAYHLFLAVCPFKKLSNFFSNKTIMNLAEGKTRLHIIDFGILYGFQWPCLIQRFSSRPGGPPKLRITGVDFAQPGFRPAERVEETGRRLRNYAKTFNVPFEFNAIADKWDTITVEDLKIDSDEVLVVNCMYRFRNLLDETVLVESPRDIVLNLIRKINPDVFITGIVNGAYNAPFFITRFREALFHFSTLFDMLETTVPRKIPERMLIEREIFGQEAMNVIACEGSERVERPETYKQWNVRNMRAGFRQLPLNREIVNMANERVNSSYHKDFVIDEDGHWLLQGWKGRISYALSSWKPA